MNVTYKQHRLGLKTFRGRPNYATTRFSRSAQDYGQSRGKQWRLGRGGIGQLPSLKIVRKSSFVGKFSSKNATFGTESLKPNFEKI